MSSNTLYRKYRPQRFADLLGQTHVAQTLQNEVERKQLGHAYLFSGPRGIGKTSSARILAKAVNCLHPKKGEPDNTCEACISINENRALDVLEIDAASYTGVDNIRDVIEHSRFTPSALTYKVFIVDEVHMLSAAAFNALLKTLEEPPSHVLFILATTELHKVPETILSRCQRFDFRRLSDADLGKRLRWIAQQEERTVDDEVIEAVVRVADGSSRDAESILGQLFALGGKKITHAEADLVLPRSNQAAVDALVTALLSNDQAQGLTLVQENADQGTDLEAFRNDIVRRLRDCLLARVIPAQQRNIPAAVQEALAGVPAQRLVRMLDVFLDVQRYVSVAPMPQLPLELAVVESTTDAPTTPAMQIQPTATAKVPTAPAPAPTPPTNGNQLWQSIVNKVSHTVPMLALSLKMVLPVSQDETSLKLASPFKLHVERLQTPKAIAILESAAGKGVTVTIHHDPELKLDMPASTTQNTPSEAFTNSPIQTPAASGDKLWDQIVSAFNG
ncbi:MAG: DNA polymerase III subunit gamma/tau [Patescibacteria group bacterium]